MPADGINHRTMPYSTVDLDANPMPAHAELPLPTVLTAVREYAHTGQQPTCVPWQPEAA
ncbi:Imm1 family immunity protein [Actinocrispum wychmicini]|uniref:Imm1 family immunity protein n=1 Tax=Actinocrispum wychmicini TaxID=1213861 RepID=UPI001050F4C2|nr:Imm1 family immunity protein [Actinocrispum wychmicini]